MLDAEPRPRRISRPVTVGNVQIGGGAPISVQSMTVGKTHEVESCLREINGLAEAGADIVRVAAEALTTHAASTGSPPQASMTLRLLCVDRGCSLSYSVKRSLDVLDSEARQQGLKTWL